MVELSQKSVKICSNINKKDIYYLQKQRTSGLVDLGPFIDLLLGAFDSFRLVSEDFRLEESRRVGKDATRNTAGQTKARQHSEHFTTLLLFTNNEPSSYGIAKVILKINRPKISTY